jgi:hypothetical protein
MLLWLTTVDWQTGPHCTHYYCAICDTYGKIEFPEQPERGWGTWREKEGAEEFKREATIQALAEGSYDFNEALTLLNDLMKHSECATWEAMQQDDSFQKGRAAVARSAAEYSDLRSQKKRKQEPPQGGGD